MGFEKFVKHSTKGIFLSIVVIMVLSLVVWNVGGPGGSASAEIQGDAGIIFENVPVSKAAFREQMLKAVPAHWWRFYEHDEILNYIRRQGGRLPSPTDESLTKTAWERLVLLEDARQKGLSATEAEVRDFRTGACYRVFSGGEIKLQSQLEMIVEQFYHTSIHVFDAWVADQVVIEKLTALAAGGEFAEYASVYDELLKQNRLVKAWYAAVDPKDFSREALPVRPEEVAKYYDKNKDKFKTQGKLQASYLLYDLEPLKAGVPEPGDADVRKYYDDNKDDFLKAHVHLPGERHREDEPKEHRPFDEVKDEVVGKIKARKAREEARRIMDQVDKELGVMAVKDGKYPADAFDQIRSASKSKGVGLIHEVTTSFDRAHADEVEKDYGKCSAFTSWAFDENPKVGDISKLLETTRGYAFFRIQKRTEGVDPGLTEPVRERVVREIRREQSRKRAALLATNIAAEITANGFAAGRAKAPLEWKVTRHFQGPAESGIEDMALAGQVAREISNVEPGKAKNFAGAGERRDLQYVVYVEDAVTSPDSNAAADFRGLWERMNRQARFQREAKYLEMRMRDAAIQNLIKKDEPRKEAPAGPPAPKP